MRKLNRKGTKVVFSTRLVATTNNQTTTEDNPNDADTIDGLSITFTPKRATNLIKIHLVGTFDGNEASDIGIFVGLYADGVILPNNKQGEYGYDPNEYVGNLSATWQGNLPATEVTIDARFWRGSPGTARCVETTPVMVVEEIEL